MAARRRIRKALAVTGVVLVVVVLAASVFAVWTVRRAFPDTEGTVEIPGLRHPVTVLRDAWGVPQLYARTDEDLFRAQGYVHAQDRFWEMDFRRHVTAGRLAELFGADQVETDEFVRTLGWRRVAEAELQLLEPRTVRLLEAYAAGVNAYLAECSGAGLSLEYAMLGLTNRGYRPEPWAPADSVAWLQAMAWDLRSNLDEEIDRALIARSLPRGRVEQLYPPYPFGRLGPHGPGLGSNSWVVDGSRTTTWTGEQAWVGYADFAALPSRLDPPEGFVVTANQAVVPPSYPLFLTDDWDPGYRAERIRERLAAADPLDVAAMTRIQLDDRNGLAPVLLPHLLRARVQGPTLVARRVLADWDQGQGADSAGAAYFNAVWRHLLRRTFDDELPRSARRDGGARRFEVVRRLLRDPRSEWWDDVGTTARERRDDVIRRAMDDAYDELADRLGDDPDRWRWGELHTLSLESPTFGRSGIAPVEWLFNRGPLEVGGGEAAVDATGWTASRGYRVDWVPSMRMVVDLADLDRSRWVNLTGASGHAFDDHYTDQAELWRTGRTTPWRWTRRAVDGAARHTLVATARMRTATRRRG